MVVIKWKESQRRNNPESHSTGLGGQISGGGGGGKAHPHRGVNYDLVTSSAATSISSGCAGDQEKEGIREIPTRKSERVSF